MSKKSFLLSVSISGLSLAAGAAGGYYVAMKRLETKYAELADREIQDTKEYYHAMHTKDKYPTATDAAKELLPEEVRDTDFSASVSTKTLERVAKGLKEMDIVPASVGEAMRKYRGEEPKVVSIFDQVAKDLEVNFEEEKTRRSHERPYVISDEEYFQNDPEHVQSTLTYFAGDDVLCDERDSPVEQDIVGEENLSRFGHHSKDKNIVYVRNEKLEQDFEIARHEESYKKHVLGYDEEDELPKRRRPRGADE